MEDRILVWFRNDLRVADNPALLNAVKDAHEVLLVYCFNPKELTQHELGFRRTGKFRLHFLLESLEDLRAELRKLGGDLIVSTQDASTTIPALCEEHHIKAVYFSEDDVQEEKKIENEVLKAIHPKGIRWKSFWTSTLIDKVDLPFSTHAIPDVFTQFRIRVEKECTVKKPLDRPTQIRLVPHLAASMLPSLSSLGYDGIEEDDRAPIHFRGGETKAWERLQHYFWQSKSIAEYKQTRNGMIGADFSSKFSPWLSLGCISARQIVAELKKFEAEVLSNESTYWLFFELLWRDFFRFSFSKNGTKYFQREGILNGEARTRNQSLTVFESWKNGATGNEFVDANMRELKATGWMSNRGRQNVASYFVHDLGGDWTWGASYFESILIDYDVCSNWGNWAYIAGVGNDPRKFRKFNLEKQSKEYDPAGAYRLLWKN